MEKFENTVAIIGVISLFICIICMIVIVWVGNDLFFIKMMFTNLIIFLLCIILSKKEKDKP
jgi:hypothetical protein